MLDFLLVCTMRMSDGSIQQIHGREGKELGQDRLLFVPDSPNISAVVMQKNDCRHKSDPVAIMNARMKQPRAKLPVAVKGTMPVCRWDVFNVLWCFYDTVPDCQLNSKFYGNDDPCVMRELYYAD
jgi:hypothetical protein